jgi:DNA-binding CsgD family transcriptional regulator
VYDERVARESGTAGGAVYDQRTFAVSAARRIYDCNGDYLGRRRSLRLPFGACLSERPLGKPAGRGSREYRVLRVQKATVRPGSFARTRHQRQTLSAHQLLQQSLRLRWALRGEVGIAMCLETLAEIAASRGQAGRAARLLGSAHAGLEASGVSLMALPISRYPGTQLPGDGQAGTFVRASLGAEEFASAWAEGQAMLTDQAVAYALATDTSSEPVASSRRSAPIAVAPGRLTRRERDVAELVGQGLTNRQIAGELVISTWTASTHVRNILAKLGVARRAQLAAWTVAHNPRSPGAVQPQS